MQKGMFNPGKGVGNEFISKTVARVQKLLLENQISFLRAKDRLRALLQEKEEKGVSVEKNHVKS